jgi:hypothetical protein
MSHDHYSDVHGRVVAMPGMRTAPHEAYEHEDELLAHQGDP